MKSCACVLCQTKTKHWLLHTQHLPESVLDSNDRLLSYIHTFQVMLPGCIKEHNCSRTLLLVTDTLSGFHLAPGAAACELMWTVAFGGPSNTILHIASKDPSDHVYTYAKVRGRGERTPEQAGVSARLQRLGESVVLCSAWSRMGRQEGPAHGAVHMSSCSCSVLFFNH